MERHLESCAACSTRARGFTEVNTLLEQWEDIQPSASFDAVLEQRILAQEGEPKTWWERLSLGFFLPPRTVAALAGSLAAVVVLAVAVTRYWPTPSTATLEEPEQTPVVVGVAASGEDLTLYSNLGVLENLEMLSNFEVLQELETSTP
jgi:anti-sigma factor RsiW